MLTLAWGARNYYYELVTAIFLQTFEPPENNSVAPIIQPAHSRPYRIICNNLIELLSRRLHVITKTKCIRLLPNNDEFRFVLS